MDKFLKIIFGLCIFFSVSLIVGLVCNYNFRLLTPFEFFFSKGAYEFDLFYNLYVSTFVGAFGSFFTVAGIYLSSKNISFLQFIKFVCFEVKSFIYFFCFIIFNSILIFFVFPQIEYCYAIQFYILCSLISIFAIFIIGINNMGAIQDKNKFMELFCEKIKYEINNFGNSNKSNFLNFLQVCFPDDYKKIMLDLYKEMDLKNKEKLDEYFIKMLTPDKKDNLTDKELADLNDRIIFIIRNRLIENVISNDKVSYNDILTKYYECAFSLYSLLVFNKYLNISYILELKTPIYLQLLDLHKTRVSSEKFESLQKTYGWFFKKSKEIIVLSLYHNDKNIVHQEIHDYMNLVQFMGNYNNVFEDLIKFHNQCLIDICTHIFNLIAMSRIPFDYISFVLPLVNQVDKIVMLYISYDMYYETLPPIDFHEVKYTRNFFIMLMMFYYFCFDSERFEEIFSKLKHERGAGYLDKVYQLESMKTDIEKINNDDFKNFDAERKITLDDKKKEINEFLDEKIESSKQRYIEVLKNIDIDDKLHDAIEETKKEIRNSLSDFYELQDHEKNGKIYDMKYVMSYSIRRLSDTDNSFVFYGNTDIYDSFLKNFFVQWYLQSANIVYIKDFIEIPDNQTLMLDISFNRYFYSHSEFDFTDKTVKVNNKSYNYEFVRMSKGVAISKTDLQKFIRFVDIKESGNIAEKVNDGSTDLIKEVEFDLQFRMNTSKEFTAYKIVE